MSRDLTGAVPDGQLPLAAAPADGCDVATLYVDAGSPADVTVT